MEKYQPTVFLLTMIIIKEIENNEGESQDRIDLNVLNPAADVYSYYII